MKGPALGQDNNRHTPNSKHRTVLKRCLTLADMYVCMHHYIASLGQQRAHHNFIDHSGQYLLGTYLKRTN
jgi:hypothetical protein